MNRELKRLEFLVLAVVQETPSHGYGIVQAIDRLTDGSVRVRPGSLYRVLDRMMAAGLLDRLDRRPTPDESADARRTYYGITPKGRSVLRSEAELLSAVATRVIASGG